MQVHWTGRENGCWAAPKRFRSEKDIITAIWEGLALALMHMSSIPSIAPSKEYHALETLWHVEFCIVTIQSMGFEIVAAEDSRF